jgi:Kef-type K+ transport system membrane component KefB
MNSGDFFFQAFIYLLAAVASVPIAKRLGLGSVLGYLIAGVLIGPHVLRLVGNSGNDVRHVAEFGVVMMLFLVGLELRPDLLWKLRGPILAILPLLASQPQAAINSGPGESAGGPWIRALVIIAVVGAIVFGGRFLIRPVFRYIALTRLHEIFNAAALLLVVGIALAMEMVGLSPALGTFLAGVVLAESEYRHELESDIEPFKGLLLGLFFISVGASIDLPLIQSQPFRIALLVLGLVTIKFAVLFVIGKVTRLESSQNFTFAFALAQGGEFAFVLVSFAVQTQLFDQGLGNLLVATVALSMVVAPFLFTINERLVQTAVLQSPANPGSGRNR